MAQHLIDDTEVSFLGTGDCGPTHGPADGFPIERYSELVRPTLAAVDLRFGDMMHYMEWASVGFNHNFSIEGDEVLIQ